MWTDDLSQLVASHLPPQSVKGQERGGGAESQESLSDACRLCVMSGLTLLAKCAGKFAQLQVSEDATVGHVKRELAALFSRTQGVGGATGCVRLSTTGGRLLAPDDARLFDIGVSSLQLLHVLQQNFHHNNKYKIVKYYCV